MPQNVVGRNNITITGDGEIPIIFAHGFGCDQNMWRYITPAFKDNFKIILFDYVGSGNSDISAYKSERYRTLNGYVQDILDVIHALELDDIIFVGHSVSSIIGAQASIEEPQRFKHLVMIGPSPCYLSNRITFNIDCDEVVLNINQAVPCAMILNEVISNSFEHAFTESEKGKITIDLTSSGKDITVSLQDNRCGLPPDFDKENNDTLGYTIVDTLVQQLEAESHIKSGQGTLFSFTFKQAEVKGANSSITNASQT